MRTARMLSALPASATSPLTRLGLAAVASVGLLASAGSARAEGCESTDSSTGGKNFHVEIINGQPVTVIDQVIQVCGKVPRPSVVYVLQAKTINYEWETLKQDFLPLILSSIRFPPF
jgi:hypothetical protein